jgi:predicted membrane protein
MKDTGDSKKLVLGLVVLTAGVLFLFNRLDMIPPHVATHLFSWQMLLIAIGVVTVAGHKNSVTGWIIMAVGGFFLLTDIFIFPATFRDVFWPLLIIGVGLVILFKGRSRGSHALVPRGGRYHEESADDTTFEDVSVFGGSKKSYHLKNMRSGTVVAIFGGSELDLRECVMSEHGAVIELFNMFGGSTLIIPKEWKVKSDVVAIFGGFDEDNQPVITEKEDKKVLFIKGLAIFGGGEIKRY